MADKNGLRVYGYIRCSHADQVSDGETLERQEQMIQDYCHRKALPKPIIIRDAGISGFKNTARPGFQKVILLCNARQADVVIVYDLSRLSRSVRDTLAFVEDTVQKNGVEFVSLMNDIDTSTPMGKAFLAITAIWNQLYRDEISYKTKAALAHKRSKGEHTGGDVPFGYSVNGGYLVADDSELATLALISDLRSAGLSLRAIAAVLRQRGIKTRRGGDRWQPQVISDLLNRSSVQFRQAPTGDLQTADDNEEFERRSTPAGSKSS